MLLLIVLQLVISSYLLSRLGNTELRTNLIVQFKLVKLNVLLLVFDIIQKSKLTGILFCVLFMFYNGRPYNSLIVMKSFVISWYGIYLQSTSSDLIDYI